MRILIVTAALAAASAAHAEPAHYDIRARLDPAKGTIEATSVVTLPADQAKGGVSFLLGDTYKVQSAAASAPSEVKVETVKTPFPAQRISFAFSRPPKSPVTLSFRYGGPLAPSGDPPLNAISPTLIELNVDSFWLPVHDDLATRFTADTEVEGVPADFVVVAPGQVTHKGSTLRIHREALDMDVAFVAAPGLKCVKEGVELCAGDPQGAVAGMYRRQGAAALKFLQDWFGPIPNGAPKVVVVSRQRDSGYARTGYVVVTDHGETPPEFRIAKFICHEFSHAWWSPAKADSEDHWLTESLAEYTGLRFVEAAFGTEDRDWYLTRKREAAAKAQPILGGGRRDEDTLYSKGPVLLFELEGRIGRAKMDAMMARLGRKPPSTTAEFLAVLADVAGADAARDFEARLRA